MKVKDVLQVCNAYSAELVLIEPKGINPVYTRDRNSDFNLPYIGDLEIIQILKVDDFRIVLRVE